jgi:hypothetical protein
MYYINIAPPVRSTAGVKSYPGNRREPEEIFMIIWQEHKQLEEKLEQATPRQFKLLQRQVATDPELSRMLTPIIREVPQYEWLVPGMYVDHHSLLDVLNYLINFDKIQTIYFSKTGNKFTGFLVYRDNGREITDIKMASFYDDQVKSNVMLAIDLIKNFIDKFVDIRSKIEWDVYVQNNTAFNQYNRLLNSKKYIWNRVLDKTGKMWVYSITGRQR